MRATGRAWMAVIALVGLVSSACSGDAPSLATRAEAESGVESTTTSSAVVTTTSRPSIVTSTTAVTAPTAPAPPPPGLGKGSTGPEVAALERRLDALRYDVGAIDDVFDQNTAYAVTAFQKVSAMDRTGRATDDVVAALATATTPAALVPGGGADRVEVDIPRQVLFLYEAGRLAKILTVSSGSNERFCSEGYCRKAVTPGGSFAVYRKGSGWEYGPLGGLYKPQYFNGGIAIHGAASVPAYPASHGCIRIPMSAAEWFPSHVNVGTPVYVVGAPEGIAPDLLQEPAPTTTTPPATVPATTTTTVDLLGSLLKPKP